MPRPGLSVEGAVLYLGFAATGVGLALPGILLPALMQAWKLQDSKAGLLFLCAWCGSSVGALLVRGKLRLALTSGGGLIALGSVGLAMLPGGNFPLLMASYGMGLGLAMTSISLLRQRQARQRSESETEMVRLNLLWAAGACACPALAVHALRSGNIRPLLIGVGVVFGSLALWAFVFLRDDVSLVERIEAPARTLRKGFLAVPLSLLLMLFLVTGIEAAAGGWLTTFAKREHGELALTVAAPTCLWAGLLLSRAIWSLRTLKFASGSIVQGSLLLLSASALLLVVGSSGWTILVAAFGIGFSLGPVYPLLLARALAFHPTGTLFFIAGLGSAALPWMTGVLSQRLSSLKDGLLVPMTAAFLMLALALLFPESKEAAET